MLYSRWPCLTAIFDIMLLASSEWKSTATVQNYVVSSSDQVQSKWRAYSLALTSSSGLAFPYRCHSSKHSRSFANCSPKCPCHKYDTLFTTAHSSPASAADPTALTADLRHPHHTYFQFQMQGCTFLPGMVMPNDAAINADFAQP